MALKIKTCEKILEMNKKKQEFESDFGPSGEKHQVNNPRSGEDIENDDLISEEIKSAIDV